MKAAKSSSLSAAEVDRASRILENDARFRAGVRKGIEAAKREEFIEEEEMDARIDQMLQS
ncbi:MAG TPA: hypothetical protein VFT60_04425 [Bryobacteraceae bacterium]|nr:hypothetical protein [Bryobacteraceae bacterium]